MRNPVDKMMIRDAWQEMHDEETDRLSVIASPIGGSFGKVRSSGVKPHQGWDLYSPLNAPAYAIANSLVINVCNSFEAEECKRDSYGNSVCLLLTDPNPVLGNLRTNLNSELFAFYGHLSSVEVSVGDQLREGFLIGRVGRSGNACHSPSHLHFEIRTVASPPNKSGLLFRIDPGELLGYDSYICQPER